VAEGALLLAENSCIERILLVMGIVVSRIHGDFYMSFVQMTSKLEIMISSHSETSDAHEP